MPAINEHSAIATQHKNTNNKIYRHLMPLLIIAYVINFLDRANMGMAQKTMSDDIGLSASAFGLGAGLFFITYALLEIPSNLILEKLGARLWIGCIMLACGLISCSMSFVNSPYSFYLVRMLLGAAEAGLYPGVMYYITLWFGREERAKATGLFLLGVVFANILGAPLGGLLLTMHGLLGYAGWQWLFFIEGIPAVLLSLVIWRKLPDTPDHAKWLNDEDKKRIRYILQQEMQQFSSEATCSFSIKRALTNRLLVLLILMYFTQQFSIYGLIYFLPGIVSHWGTLSSVQIGLTAAVPWVAAGIGGMTLPRLARNERHSRQILIIGYIVMATGMLIGTLSNGIIALAGFCLAALMFFAVQSTIYSYLTNIMSGRMLAGSIGMLTCLGLCGGFLGPFILGLFEDYTGTASSGLWFAVVLLVAGALLATLLQSQSKLR